MEEATGGGEAGGQNRMNTKKMWDVIGNGDIPLLCVYYICFFFRGPLGLDVGFFFIPLRKWVSSYRSKKNNNPNPSPTGNGFGLYWSGARGGT